MVLYSYRVPKVELVKVTTPQDSRSQHELLTQDAEAVLKVSQFPTLSIFILNIYEP